MNESILSAPLYFEAAVQRKLLLAGVPSGSCLDDKEIIVEVIAASERLNRYDVVVDFRELEAALDEQLILLQDNLPNNFGIRDMLLVASRLAEKIEPIMPALSKIMEISFIYNCGRRISLRP
jgi:hypothetical protein